MPFAEWPQHDRVAWLVALEPAGFLEAGGVAAEWSEGGRRMVVDSYGRWLTWLARTEQLDRSARPEDRVTRERVAAYAEALLVGNAPMTVQGRIGQLGRAMRALAPVADWSWLSRAADRMRAEAAPVREKRSRMQEVQALADLGLGLMRRAQASDEHFAIQRAALYRDGLIIALLAHRPLRIRTFAAVTLGQHLTRRDKEWRLAFAAADTKTRQPLEMPFPDGLVPCLELYLGQHRPVLLRGKPVPGQARPPTSALWIAKGGRMMSSDAISVQITTHTRTAFGQPVNPHLFRDCAATSIAIQDPEHVRMIAPILGHSTIATSERHYNQARTLEASRRYQQAIGRTRRTVEGQQS
jgi:site-specific recombinase XerD